jgi:hypothetical protein
MLKSCIAAECFTDQTVLTVIVILESEALNKFDEEQLRSYYDDPLRCAEEAIREMACKGYRHGGDMWLSFLWLRRAHRRLPVLTLVNRVNGQLDRY